MPAYGKHDLLCSLSALPFHPLRTFIPDIPPVGGRSLSGHEGSMVESGHPLHPPCVGHPSSEHYTKLSAPGCHQGWSSPAGRCRPGTPSHPHLSSRWGICPHLGPQWSREDVALSNRPEPAWFGPRHAHGDLTSLAPQERLPELPVVPRVKPHTGAAFSVFWWPGTEPLIFLRYSCTWGIQNDFFNAEHLFSGDGSNPRTVQVLSQDYTHTKWFS